MARNCEKKLIGLNRLWLEKQRKDELEKNPKRPHLRSLNSASEVKKWIPGIKREIDYCLDQISGARQHRYPDTKIKEFERKVEELEKEYKRFVKKVYELDPSTTGIPWQPRGYVSKRKNMESSTAETLPKKICTPLLDEEKRICEPSRSDKEDKKSSELADCSQKRGSVATAKTMKDIPNNLKLQQHDVDVKPKSVLRLDYSSSSDSEIS